MLARLLMANQNLILDAGSRGQEEGNFWAPILMTTGDDEGYHELYSTLTGPDVEDYLSVRPENLNSIVNCIRTARENARMIRDQIPDEVWRSVNDLYLLITSGRGSRSASRPAWITTPGDRARSCSSEAWPAPR